jgi:hypothetical protein
MITDGILSGWHQTQWLIGYALGAIPSVLVAIAIVAIPALIVRDAPHRWRVWRFRRDIRRTGRTVNPRTGHTSDGLNLGPSRNAGRR